MKDIGIGSKVIKNCKNIAKLADFGRNITDSIGSPVCGKIVLYGAPDERNGSPIV
jgi:hypothetical protein